MAKSQSKPFFLMANTQDPHRAFPRSAQQQQKSNRRKNAPPRKTAAWPGASRVIRPEEVEVPGFLPDVPDVRKEVAQYFTAVHRCDQAVGGVLKALAETGLAESTLVMFLSDNGMAFPFAKTNVYLSSTRTPWLVRWPGVVKAGVIDREHFISGIDVFHRTAGRRDYEMRCVQTARFGYLFNPWSDGETVFLNESQSGLTFKAMQRAAETDPGVAARVKLFRYRVPEEFYDYENDPCARKNLIDDPQREEEIKKLRGRMLEIMRSIDDPLTEKLEEVVDDR